MTSQFSRRMRPRSMVVRSTRKSKSQRQDQQSIHYRPRAFSDSAITSTKCEDMSCPICLEQIDLSAKAKCKKCVRLNPCNHIFHRKCAKHWFMAEALRGKSTPSCPLCRTAVEPSKVPMTSNAAGWVYKVFAKVVARVVGSPKSKRRHQEASVTPTLRIYLAPN